MPVTSLKLPEELKKRISALVKGTDRTPHGFMVEAIARETERAELRGRFELAAAEAEDEAIRTGRAFDADEVFAYLRRKVAGKKVRRPRAKTWRR